MEKILMLIGVFAIVSCNSGSGGGSSGSAEAEMCSFDNFTAFLFTDKKYRIDSSYVGDAKEESIEGERCEIREDKVSCTSYDDTSSHNAYEIDRETYVKTCQEQLSLYENYESGKQPDTDVEYNAPSVNEEQLGAQTITVEAGTFDVEVTRTKTVDENNNILSVRIVYSHEVKSRSLSYGPSAYHPTIEVLVESKTYRSNGEIIYERRKELVKFVE